MIAWFVRNGVAANILMGVILVAGFASIKGIKMELFPDFDLDVITGPISGRQDFDTVIDSYHAMSHHGQREDKLTQLAVVEKFLMERLAHFIERLKDTKQADGTSLLSSTQVLFGSGLGSGSRHTNENLPIILAGGGFKHGQHVNGQNKQPLCNLYLSMLQHMGAEQDAFNRSQGTLTGLA